VGPGDVFQRQLVEPEGAAEQRDVFVVGVADVEPQAVLAVGEQLGEALDGTSTGRVWVRVSRTSRITPIGGLLSR
jgi:hypothetical protein